MLRFLTAGESHGESLVAILEGLPAGLEIRSREINAELARRQKGAGRGKRMEIESFKLETINFIKRADHRDGTGSLKIAYGVEKDSDGDPRPLTTDWPGIPDAKRAEALIRERAKWAR